MRWLRLSSTMIGLLAFCALVWIAGPLIAIADARPFESVLVRALIIGAVVLIVFVVWLLRFLARRRKAKKIEKAIVEAPVDPGDAPVLNERMRDAIATLKASSRGKSGFLYELPWYVIIGPPGAGKTTALVNSGLKFPLSSGGQARAIEGTGGTRYCDWWFTDEAVLIDTAGRYTTQDSDAVADRRSWTAFLDLLKVNRPRQPINGVIVAIGIDDLLGASQAEIAAHAEAVRKRLLQLHTELKVDFPVYAMFTKADLLAGFTDYFADLDDARRRMVWGATFQTTDRKANKVGEVGAEIDLLVERLNERLPQRLQEEPDLRARAILFGFPAQVAAVKRPVVEFLNRIFEPSRYHANATLRGFYFTSGTQEGTPFDQVIGALARSYGVESAAAPAYSGVGRSFFLHDLLKKVVFAEAGWVSTNLGAVRRALIARTVGYSLVAIATVAVAGLWWTSYQRNLQTIQQTERAVETYRTAAGPLLQEAEITDSGLQEVYERVHGLLYLPNGYASREEPTPLIETFGLSQRSRLQAASEQAYRVALERLFRPRLILRLEEQIEANLNDPNFLYEALKVYMMLGGQAPEVDRDLIMAWEARDWQDNLFPGPGAAAGRERLAEHLAAMLDLDVGATPLVELNGPLLEDAQRSLARLSVAERAYALLRSEARGLPLEDWQPALRGGQDADFVFETLDGSELTTISVPGFYTYNGFYTGLLDRLLAVADQIREERWVLGESGDQEAVESQFASIAPDVLALYTADFIALWDAALQNLRLQSFTADRPRYEVLLAASAPTSPVMQLFESVRDETALTVEREEPEPEEQGGGVLEGAALRAAGRMGGRFGRAGLEMALESQERPGDAPLVPGVDVETHFRAFHVLVEGDPGARPLDSLIANFRQLYDSLVLSSDPTRAQQAVSDLQVQVANLRANASRLPPPLSNMVAAVANDIEGDATGTSIDTLNDKLANEVTGFCQQTINNHYPFSQDSDRDVAVGEFGRLFAPNGVMDRFFFTNLDPLVDRSGDVWTWRDDVRLTQEMSAATLRHFQAAAEIRDAFFSGGGSQPSFAVTIQGVTLSGQAEAAVLTVNGTSIIAQHGPNLPGTIQWPSTGGLNEASVTLLPELPDRRSSLSRSGVWSLFRLIDGGSALRRDNGISASFVIGGREVSYQFAVSSLLNPLALPALREFRCPSGF